MTLSIEEQQPIYYVINVVPISQSKSPMLLSITGKSIYVVVQVMGSLWISCWNITTCTYKCVLIGMIMLHYPCRVVQLALRSSDLTSKHVEEVSLSALFLMRVLLGKCITSRLNCKVDTPQGTRVRMSQTCLSGS